MKATELIAYLDGLVKTYGDLDVIFEDEYTELRVEVLDIIIEYNHNDRNTFKLTNFDYKYT
jgi:hypothetical protein